MWFWWFVGSVAVNVLLGGLLVLTVIAGEEDDHRRERALRYWRARYARLAAVSEYAMDLAPDGFERGRVRTP